MRFPRKSESEPLQYMNSTLPTRGLGRQTGLFLSGSGQAVMSGEPVSTGLHGHAQPELGLGRCADDTSTRALPTLSLLSYQVPSLKQDDQELPGLQFGLQFTPVRPSSLTYTHPV